MKAKKKINYGFLFGIAFSLIVLIYFVIMASRMTLVKDELIQKTKAYQEAIIEGYILNSADVKAIEDLRDSDESVLKELSAEIAAKQWQQITEKIGDDLIDQDFSERGSKSFAAILENGILENQLLTDFQPKYDQQFTYKWNMLQEVQIALPCEITFTYQRLSPVSSFNPNLEYSRVSVFWKKVDGEWKIYKAEPVTPNLFLAWDNRYY